MLTGTLQQPLYQILVPLEATKVVSCEDTYYVRRLLVGTQCLPESTRKLKVLGWDIEPAQIARVRHNDIFQELVAEVATVSRLDVQPYLWIEERTN